MTGERDLERRKCTGCGQFAKLNEDLKCKNCEEETSEQATGGPPGRLDEKERDHPDDCGHCKKRVHDNQRGLLCELCDWWYHIGCQKVGVEEYNLHKEKKIKSKWFCLKCNTSFKTLKKVNRDMKDENVALKIAYKDKEEENLTLKRTSTEIEQENITLRENNKQLTDQVKKLEAKIENLRIQLKKEILEEVFEELEERNEKERKKNNLLIFGIEEADYASRQEKVEGELNICVQVFEEIQSEVRNEDIVETFRIGKRRNVGEIEGRGEERQTQARKKPRPILVKLRDERTKWNIIKRAKTIRQSRIDTLKNVWIVPDLTMRERERDRELRQELQEKRDAGEEGWFIRRGKLQRRNFL